MAVIADPPSEPSVKATVNLPTPGVMPVIVGADGTVAVACGVMLFEAAEAELVPAELAAVTEQV